MAIEYFLILIKPLSIDQTSHHQPGMDSMVTGLYKNSILSNVGKINFDVMGSVKAKHVMLGADNDHNDCGFGRLAMFVDSNRIASCWISRKLSSCAPLIPKFVAHTCIYIHIPKSA